MQYIMSLGIPWGGSPLRGFEGEFLFVHPGSHAADPPAAVKVQRRVRVVQVDLPLVFVAAEMEINRGVGVCRLRYRWNKSTCHLSFAMRPGRVDSCFLYCLLLQFLYLLPKGMTSTISHFWSIRCSCTIFRPLFVLYLGCYLPIWKSSRLLIRSCQSQSQKHKTRKKVPSQWGVDRRQANRKPRARSLAPGRYGLVPCLLAHSE